MQVSRPSGPLCRLKPAFQAGGATWRISPTRFATLPAARAGPETGRYPLTLLTSAASSSTVFSTSSLVIR